MERLMRLAIAEAQRGGRAVRPNPKVGCAIELKTGQVIVGFHKRCGGPHAEVEALEACRAQGLDPRGATVAVTLEPCSHFGRTPPCADALVRAGVARVIVGVEDPFPQVSGRGLEKLRAAGIEVVVGVLREECEALNREWLFAHRNGRSFVTVKMATSLDGRWTAQDGESRWITGESARARGHALRARVDAIVTGQRTLQKDDPRLTARVTGVNITDAEQPKVFVLSRSTAVSLSAHRVSDIPGRAESAVAPDLKIFFEGLYRRGLHDVMIEAGPTLSASALASGMADEIWLFLGPKFLGGAGLALPALGGGRLPGFELKIKSVETLPGGDLLLICGSC